LFGFFVVVILILNTVCFITEIKGPNRSMS